MFPASTNSLSKAILSENGGRIDIMELGQDEQAEQLLQILESSKLRDRIINLYNLKSHYNIKPGTPNSQYIVNEIYNDNINCKRTKYGAVIINVLDEDPLLAADIANTISDQLDTIKNAMHHERAEKAFQIIKKEYESLSQRIAVQEDSLTKIRQKGVVDYESQSEMLNRQLAIELAKGNESAINRLNKKISVLAKYGGAYVSIRDNLELDHEQLSNVKIKYDEAKIDATQVLPQKFIVDKAYPAEKKSYPIRWLIVISVVFSALLFSSLLIVLRENWKKQKH